jgi:MFS family permease
MLLGVLAVAYFGVGHDTLNGWRLATFLQMFFLNAAIVGYYAAFARGFPAYARATGTGFALGIGRAGAAGSPIVAGILFDHLGKQQLLPVSIIMAMGSLVGIVLMLMLPLRDADRDLFETSDSKGP